MAIDSTMVKVDQDGTEVPAKRGQAIGRSRGGVATRYHKLARVYFNQTLLACIHFMTK